MQAQWENYLQTYSDRAYRHTTMVRHAGVTFRIKWRKIFRIIWRNTFKLIQLSAIAIRQKSYIFCYGDRS